MKDTIDDELLDDIVVDQAKILQEHTQKLERMIEEKFNNFMRTQKDLRNTLAKNQVFLSDGLSAEATTTIREELRKFSIRLKKSAKLVIDNDLKGETALINAQKKVKQEQERSHALQVELDSQKNAFFAEKERALIELNAEKERSHTEREVIVQKFTSQFADLQESLKCKEAAL